MSYIHYKIKYPCGLEIDFSVSTILGSFKMSNEDFHKICPLHGKNCKSQDKHKAYKKQ